MFLTLVTCHTIQNALTINEFLFLVPWETSIAMLYWTLDALFMPCRALAPVAEVGAMTTKTITLSVAW